MSIRKSKDDSMSKEYNGYDYWQDDNGDFWATDRTTGETIPATTIVAPIGSHVHTPQDQNRHKQWLEEQEERQKQRRTSHELGRHFFVPSNQDFPDLKPQTVTRLIYLATYSDYSDRGNKLKLTQKTDMHYDDLRKVLGLSRDAVKDFWDEVSPKYIVKDNDELMFTEKSIFIRGKLDKGTSYHKMYIEWIRTLYAAAPKSKHKHLGYLFQMLPYVNIEFNTLCHDPFEKNLNRIDYMTPNEFCRQIGFDESNLHRLLKTYRDLRFEVDGKLERACSVVYDGVDRGNGKMFINPHILYSGTNHERVEILGEFCKD